jgi:hypothetical protein
MRYLTLFLFLFVLLLFCIYRQPAFTISAEQIAQDFQKEFGQGTFENRELLLITNPFFRLNKEEQHNLAKTFVNYPNGFIVLDQTLPKTDHIAPLVRLCFESGKKGRVHKISKEGPFVLTWASVKPKSTKIQDLSQQGHQVTYLFSGGRMGDNLLAYFHARWLCYKYNLPLVYAPFKLSDRFQLVDHRCALEVTNKQVVLEKEEQINFSEEPTLFAVPYFSECAFEFGKAAPDEFGAPMTPPFAVDWEDEAFRLEMMQCLTPSTPIAPLQLPEGCLKLAVHIRRGVKQKGGADSRTARRAFPLKFPPDSYYIEEIKRVAALFPDKKLYVYLFTDYPKPHTLLKKYRKAIKNPDIEFATGESRGDEETLLKDFCAFTQFDCLILCQSNFSLIPSKLKDFAIVTLPTHSYNERKCVTVDEIDLRFNGSIR